MVTALNILPPRRVIIFNRYTIFDIADSEQTRHSSIVKILAITFNV
jgi:hypothetical protein